MRKFIPIFFLLMMALSSLTQAQSSNKEQIAKQYLAENFLTLGLTQADVNDVILTDLYETKHNGRVHAYFNQAVNGYEVEDAVFNITLRPDNSVLHTGNTFVSEINSKVSSSKLLLDPTTAIVLVAEDLDLEMLQAPVGLKAKANGTLVFSAPEVASGKITAKPKYFEISKDVYRLAWEIYFPQINSLDKWLSYIDAEDGSVLNTSNTTVKCKLVQGKYHNHSRSCRGHSHKTNFQKKAMMSGGDGSQYNVLALPTESPVHGDFQLVVDPSNEVASPFGWHDVDGSEGAEFTITRGNNVHAFEDSAQSGVSQGNEPEGGADLVFNYSYDANLNAFDNMEADVTNTFYMTNMVHDIMYNVGWDEAAGNFQNNNYGNGGEGNDEILANCLDPAAANNATWGGGGPDGESPEMSLGIWDNSAGLFRVLGTTSVAGEYDSTLGTQDNDWGGPATLEEIDIEAELVLVADSNPQTPQQGCGELVNDVSGKIAIIFRGSCEFGTKAFNAKSAGAVAAIICNVPGADAQGSDGENAMGMLGGDDGMDVDIPVISLGFSDCNRIVADLENGAVTAQMKILPISGPTELSTGLDNGVIAHEVGHGVSIRLIGGPNNARCINNGENLGDGIADFMTLMMTVEPGDTGADARGIGAYVVGEDADGRGIRTFPYSTDFNVNPQTYDAIKAQTDPHPIGEPWVAVSWDVFWAFVDLYGFDETWADPTKGNYRAAQLAVDAFKTVSCDPGFIDLRDAYMAADDKEHECLLWEIFARRGLGYYADQGSNDDTSDGIQDFESLPACIQTLKLKKEIADLVVAGEDLTVKFTVGNDATETATNVIVTDVLDEGMSVASVDAGINYTETGNMVVFEIGDLATGEYKDFSYVIATDPSKFSITRQRNDVESFEEQNEWLRDIGEGNNIWDFFDSDAYSGDFSWFVREIDGESDQRLIYPNIVVDGNRPTFRIYNRANTTALINGGNYEISTDNNIWLSLNEELVLGGYSDVLDYSTFAIPNSSGFSGPSNKGEWIGSYIDLSKWAGQTVFIRMRFGTQDEDVDVIEEFGDDRGWYIDAAELMNLKSYITEASISSDNLDTQLAGRFETIIDSQFPDSVVDLEDEGVSINLFPNPAGDFATLAINSQKNLEANIAIISMEGKKLSILQASIHKNENFINLDLANLTPGFYLVQIASGDKVSTKKLVIE